MRKTSLVYILGVSVLLVSALTTSVYAVSDVANTVHNLSASSEPFNLYASTETEICIFCHTPHGGSLTGPLWNRGDLTDPFTMYTSSTTSATVNAAAATNAVNSESMLCLSCHDGSVSVYEMLNYSSAGIPVGINVGADMTVQNGFTSVNPNIGGGSLGVSGGQLSDDHPISFSYDGVLADYTAAVKTGLKLVSAMPAAISSRLYAAGNRVECSTCHNPHEATLPSFLVMSNAGSALCLGCHDK